MLHYHVSLSAPDQHEFVVKLTFQTHVDEGPTRFTLPAWIPGSYLVRDFAKHINDLEVKLDGVTVDVSKVDKQTWELQPATGTVSIGYRVYAWDETVRTAYFDRTRAFFNGTSLFLRVLGKEQQLHRLTLNKPEFKEGGDWSVATTMPVSEENIAGYGDYQTESYEQFIDYPFEIGNLRRALFELNGVAHEMVYMDAPGADIERVCADLQPVVAEHMAMFGELPVQRYLFMTLATANGYGGLEHRDSTALICKRSDLPYARTENGNKGYRQFISLCSHEYFHLWNVKRIKPALLQRADLSHEVNTELLWAFEGITSYYDELALPRSGFLTPEEYLDMLAPSVTRLMRNQGRHRQSIAESSFDAWTKFYKQDEDASNAIVSYYNKGAFVSFGLDHWIRTESSDRLCLDDLMRELWQRHGKPEVGIAEREIEKVVEELVGADPRPFFDAYIYGTEELPLAEWFADFGIKMSLRSARQLSDAGGYVSQVAKVTPPVNWLGARTSANAELVKVEAVFTAGSAQQAGISPGDLLVALNNERCTQSNLDELLGRYKAGDEIEVALFRRDRLMHLSMVLQEARADTCDLLLMEKNELSDTVVKRRNDWLASSQGMVAK